MGDKFWKGASADWADSSQWTPAGAPQAGDTAFIHSGTPEISGVTIQAVTIDLTGGPYYTADLQLTSTEFDNGTVLNESGVGANLYYFGNNSLYGTVNVTGYLYFKAANGGAGPTGEALTNYGTVNVTGGGSSVIAYQGNTFDNEGLITVSDGGFADAVSGATFINNGTISYWGASIYLSNFAGPVTGSGSFDLQNAVLEFDSAVPSTQTIAFTGTGGVLELNGDLLDGGFRGTIRGFAPGDTIDLGTGAPDSIVFHNDVATLELAGSKVAELNIVGDYRSSDFVLTPDGLGNELLEIRHTPCFARGTRVRTPDGESAVEELAIGQFVLMASGQRREIIWVGERRVDCRCHPEPELVWPIRVRADAFGDGVPTRDLLLSPDHAIYAEQVLIPVKYLVNGVTIMQEPRASIHYFHVELARHDVLLAEGLPTESYLDTGNRAQFANGLGALNLYCDFARGSWANDACAPLHTSGTRVRTVRRRLANRMEQLGYQIAPGPEPELVTGGRRIRAIKHQGFLYRFVLPPGAWKTRIVSGSSVPAGLDLNSEDCRSLGVRVGALFIDGELVPWRAGPLTGDSIPSREVNRSDGAGQMAQGVCCFRSLQQREIGFSKY